MGFEKICDCCDELCEWEKGDDMYCEDCCRDNIDLEEVGFTRV